ncbi:unnamed protein product [Leptidea sinapis]|uniref:CFA20 domain-containing protein n=1 Tax=Leptidea sinapis TaxID=189913 RepID=A0A5E4R684_9NEOP|nr:unnamed protein product [Leptidea sinapis]
MTILFSGGSKPLSIWATNTESGYVSRFLDPDIKSMVLEVGGTNVSTTYITCPKDHRMTLGITMPFLVMIVKNLKKYFSFEVTILDESGVRRRFRVSNFQSTTQIQAMCTVMPIGLSDGWNQIQFNLAEFTRRAYKKQFTEVVRLQINANIRIRRIYFAEKLIPDDELPPEYKLYFPLGSKKEKKGKQASAKELQSKPPIQAIAVEAAPELPGRVSKVSVNSAKQEPAPPVEAKVTPGAHELKVEPQDVAQTIEEPQKSQEPEEDMMQTEGTEEQTEIMQEVIHEVTHTPPDTAVSEPAEPGAPSEDAEV